jgi:integrase
MVIFAAATGLRPAEWLALEWRDIDLEARIALRPPFVHEGPAEAPEDRSEPTSSAAADDRARRDQTAGGESPQRTCVCRRTVRYLDLHNFRNREWKPAQIAVGIEPLRRIYDLRHTFATFALRAGISTFDLSRLKGAKTQIPP